jgi:DHA2 family multidrug resistance protein
MSTVDTTIANVALPHVQSSLSAAPDQIAWVLTSYILATAIFTPLTGWLASRLGRRNLLVMALIGFTATSMLCGAAQNVPQIVLFRFLQGMFCAPIVPMSQTLMLDVYPTKKHASAMSIWSTAGNIGPIMGPLLGGWLTDSLDWRWVFYINLPFGILAAAAVLSALDRDRKDQTQSLDGLGYGFLVLSAASFQLMLDRGQILDWFESPEIALYSVLAPLGIIVFVIHTWTARSVTFLERAILVDRNYRVGIFFCLVLSGVAFSTMALVPTLMQDLMGYSAYQTGEVTMSRGLMSVVGGLIVGSLADKIDARAILAVGFLMLAVGSWQMTGYSLQMDGRLTVISGGIQGLGTTLCYVPLVTLTFSTIPPQYRAKASSLFSLVRNLGASAGISAMQVLLYRNTQITHSRLTEGVRADNPVLQSLSNLDLSDAATLVRLNEEVTRQAQMIAYIHNFWLHALAVCICIPTVMFFRKARGREEGVSQAARDVVE